jgi:hypothetical protein
LYNQNMQGLTVSEMTQMLGVKESRRRFGQGFADKRRGEGKAAGFPLQPPGAAGGLSKTAT